MFQKKILLTVVVTVISLYFTELYLRFIHYPSQNCENIESSSEDKIGQFDPLLGWSYILNKETIGDYGVRYTISKEGYRTSTLEETREDKKPIILLVGDSNLFGHGLNYEDTIGSKLEKELNYNYSILNFSVQGYGTDQIYLLIQKLVPLYRPAVVISNYIPEHDLRNMIDDRRELFPCFKYPGTKPRFTINKGYLNQLTRPQKYSDYDRYKLFILMKSFINKLSEQQKRIKGRELTQKLVDATDKYVSENGAQFYLIDLDSDQELQTNTGKVLGISTETPNNIYHLSTKDPHPNAEGTTHIVDTFLKKYKNNIFAFTFQCKVDYP